MWCDKISALLYWQASIPIKPLETSVCIVQIWYCCNTRETQRRERPNLRRGKARWGRKGRGKAREAIRKARKGEVELIQLSPGHFMARQRRERAREVEQRRGKARKGEVNSVKWSKPRLYVWKLSNTQLAPIVVSGFSWSINFWAFQLWVIKFLGQT